jgi:hypothetical protein
MNILLLLLNAQSKQGRKNKTPYQGNAIDFFFFHSQFSRDSLEETASELLDSITRHYCLHYFLISEVSPQLCSQAINDRN